MQEGPKSLGDRQHPLADGQVRDHLVGQVGRHLRHASGVAGGAHPSKLISALYPPTLRDAGIGGVVIVWFFVEESGRVADTRVAQSSGYEQLDVAALQVSDRFVFSPALLNDQFVPVWVQFPITFAIR